MVVPPPPEQQLQPAPGYAPAPLAPAAPRRSGWGAFGVVLAILLGAAALIVSLTHSGAGTPFGGGAIAVNTSSLPISNGTPASVAAALTPSVATIVVSTGPSSAGASGLGSGFVISNSGSTSYILTNNHVVTGASGIEVVMADGTIFTGTLVGADPTNDVAVVSVPSGHLPAVTFGSSASLTVGQQVVAIGSPLGNQDSVTTGVISALHRTITAGDQAGGSSENLADVLQTDASINPGNSGGPLADLSGRVVGINVATSSGGTNVSFSIPADTARAVATQIINHKTVSHPYIGVGFLTPLAAVENGQPFQGPGVQVVQVTPGSPAASAGVQTGDIITAVNGTALGANATLGSILAGHQAGDHLVLSIRRGSQSLTITVTLAERPANFQG